MPEGSCEVKGLMGKITQGRLQCIYILQEGTWGGERQKGLVLRGYHPETIAQRERERER